MDHFLAYLDPGSGSLIIQVVIATIVAVPFFLRRQISTIVGALHRVGRRSHPSSAGHDDHLGPNA